MSIRSVNSVRPGNPGNCEAVTYLSQRDALIYLDLLEDGLTQSEKILKYYLGNLQTPKNCPIDRLPKLLEIVARLGEVKWVEDILSICKEKACDQRSFKKSFGMALANAAYNRHLDCVEVLLQSNMEIPIDNWCESIESCSYKIQDEKGIRANVELIHSWKFPKEKEQIFVEEKAKVDLVIQCLKKIFEGDSQLHRNELWKEMLPQIPKDRLSMILYVAKKISFQPLVDAISERKRH